MYYAKCNAATFELLELSNETIDDGELVYPIIVKVFNGDMPNLNDYRWNKTTMSFEQKENTVVSKITFRRRFTFEEQIEIDEFNDTFLTLEYLTNEQKKIIRTALKNYNEANEVNTSDPYLPILLGLYVQVGKLQPNRINEIINGI